MKKALIFIMLVLFISCKSTPVIEHSPEVSKLSHAINDSFESARIDLASKYSAQLYSLVTPPIEKIIIKPIYKNGKRIAVIPKQYQQDEAIIIDTEAWNKLAQTKEIANQLTTDNNNLKEQLINIEEEKRKQENLKLELAAENVKLTVSVEKLDKMLFKFKLYLAVSLFVIVGYCYLKIKKLLII